jgi:type IV secretion system protein VirD4
VTPTKLLIGQILIVFAIVVAGLWAATQWTATMLGYQPQLGLPWFMLGELPVYRPWSLFPWWYHYGAYAPHVFDKTGMLAGASGFLGCGAAIAGSLWRARQARHVTTYGSARWATDSEIERAGLFREAGVFLGHLHAHYLRHDGPEHVMAFAPTSSEWLVFSQWLRRSSAPSGSTRMSAMFWTSRTSCAPRRTSSSGL